MSKKSERRSTRAKASRNTPEKSVERHGSIDDANMHWGNRAAEILVLALLGIILLSAAVLFTSWTTEGGRVKFLVIHLLILLGIVVVVFRTAWTGHITLRPHPLHWAILGFVALSLITTLLSQFRQTSKMEFWRIAMCGALYALAVYAVKTRKRARVLLGIMEIAIFLVVAYAFVQELGCDVVEYGRSPQTRVFSFLGNPNMLAGFLVLSFWLLVGIALDAKNLAHRIFLLALLVSVLICLVLTYTKGAWIAFMVSVFLALIWGISGWNLPYAINRRKLVLVALGIVIAFGILGTVFHRTISGRLGTLHDSARVRLIYWSGAIKAAREHPILGTGPGTFQIVFPDKRAPDFHMRGVTYNTLHAHSEPLEILVEMGIVGLALFLWLVFVFYRKTLQRLGKAQSFSQKGALVGIILGVSALLLHNLIDVNLRWYTTGPYFWFLLGLSVALCRLMNGNEENRNIAIPIKVPRIPRLFLALTFSIVLAYFGKTYVVDSFLSEIYYRQSTDAGKLGKWDAALAFSKKAIAKDPFNLRAYYHQAYCYHEEKMYAESVRCYLHLEKLAPNYCRLHANLAVLYGKMGYWEEAAARFVKADRMGLASENYSTEGLIAELHRNIDDKKRYLAILETMAKSNPDDPIVYNYIGMHYLEKSEFRDAARHFQKALEINPKYLPALKNLGEVFFLEKKYDSVVETCKRILAIDPDSHKMRINLGRAYYLQGEKEKAVEEWREVLRRVPDEPEASACLRDVAQRGDNN